jgi:hypothetical protein
MKALSTFGTPLLKLIATRMVSFLYTYWPSTFDSPSSLEEQDIIANVVTIRNINFFI